MRILVAYKDAHRCYRETIATAISYLCSDYEARPVGLDGFAEEVARFKPHAVLREEPNDGGPCDVTVWAELSAEEPVHPGEVLIGKERRILRNPTLTDVVAILEEANERLREVA